MAIVKMNKFTLLSFHKEKEKLLEALQSFGKVQFINLQEEDLDTSDNLKNLEKDSIDLSSTVNIDILSKITSSIDFLKTYIKERSGINSMIASKETMTKDELKEYVVKNSWQDIYDEIKEREAELNYINSEISKNDGEIEKLKGWINLDIPFNAIKELNYSKGYIGTIPQSYKEEFTEKFSTEIDYGYMEIIDTNNTDIFIFILVMNQGVRKLEKLLRKYGFNTFLGDYKNTPKEIKKVLTESSEAMRAREIAIKTELSSYHEKYKILKYCHEYYNNLVLRDKASEYFLKTAKVLNISGWVPSEDKESFINLVDSILGESYNLSFEEIAEGEIDEIPVKLKNKGFFSAFEGILEMYSLPKYNEIDPTPILSVFYFIFFGMMLSDAGYGLVITILSFLAIKITKDKEKKKNYKLFLYAGISTVIWGAVYGGWFGDIFPNYFGIKLPYLIDPAKNITTVLILSVIMGIIHIFMGLGIKGYLLIKNKKYQDAIYDVLTWYSTLTGAILWGLGVGGPLGKILFIIGIVGLLLTQGRAAPTLGGKIGWGIYGVYGITSYLGDVVSYSRLLALGLATGFIANALNLIVSLIPSPLNIIVSPILFIGLHVFNLLVNALGAYVHAARLQYLEFFNKFYEGGGKKFQPYKISDKYIKIIK